MKIIIFTIISFLLGGLFMTYANTNEIVKLDCTGGDVCVTYTKTDTLYSIDNGKTWNKELIVNGINYSKMTNSIKKIIYLGNGIVVTNNSIGEVND